MRRKQHDQNMNELEKKAFMSINSSLGWIGTAASPLCSFYSSYLQQKAPELRFKNLIEQYNILRKLKRNRTTITYKRTDLNKELSISVLSFSDASKIDENGQIGILTGLLIGTHLKTLHSTLFRVYLINLKDQLKAYQQLKS